MDDLISRQAAISAICNACGKIDCDKMDKCEKLQLPPANCSEFPNNSDTISRQAVKEILDKNQMPYHVYPYVWDAINALPPAQPEPDINDVTCDNCKYSEKFVDGLILCRRTKTSNRVFATSTCGKGKREVTE